MPCFLAQQCFQANRARGNSRSMRLISFGRQARRNRKRLGRLKPPWRAGTLEKKTSRRWAAESAMRFAQQDGHTPRFLQENPTSCSSRHEGQRTRAKPWRKMRQRRYRSNSARMDVLAACGVGLPARQSPKRLEYVSPQSQSGNHPRAKRPTPTLHLPPWAALSFDLHPAVPSARHRPPSVLPAADVRCRPT